MKWPPRKADKKIVLLLLGVGVILLIVLAVLYGRPVWDYFSDQERIEATVRDAGAWGPIVFIALQAVQILIAPIPGQVSGFAAGYIFGAGLGTLYAMIGATFGFWLVFVLARKLGRPFVEYFVDKKTLQKFDYLIEGRGVFIFFLIFLLPAFPDDIICYIAGLTKIPIRTLLIVSVLGRLPSNFALAIAGQGAAESNTKLVVIVTAAGLIIALLGWWKREQLERLTKSLSKPADSKKEP